jgi:hypothetical protein
MWYVSMVVVGAAWRLQLVQRSPQRPYPLNLCRIPLPWRDGAAIRHFRLYLLPPWKRRKEKRQGADWPETQPRGGGTGEFRLAGVGGCLWRPGLGPGWAGPRQRRRAMEAAVEAPTCVGPCDWLRLLQVRARNRPMGALVTPPAGMRIAPPCRAPVSLASSTPRELSTVHHC